MRTLETQSYRYEFATNETVTIGPEDGVSAEWIGILQDLDREERNNNDRMRRHKCSLDAYDPEGQHVTLENSMESWAWNLYLLDSVSTMFTARQLEVFVLHFCYGLSLHETAARMGVSANLVKKTYIAIRRKLWTIYEGGNV